MAAKNFKPIPWWRFFRNKYLLTFLLFALWVAIFDKNNLINWIEQMRNISQMEKEKTFYQKEIKSTIEKLQELQSNNDSLEKFAREQYFFIRPGEEVFIVE